MKENSYLTNLKSKFNRLHIKKLSEDAHSLSEHHIGKYFDSSYFTKWRHGKQGNNQKDPCSFVKEQQVAKVRTPVSRVQVWKLCAKINFREFIKEL